MIHKGFKMKLYDGMAEEYEKRHNEFWTELKDIILENEDEELWAKGADTAINRKWWDFMADIKETNPDNSPVSEDLHLVFHLD